MSDITDAPRPFGLTEDGTVVPTEEAPEVIGAPLTDAGGEQAVLTIPGDVMRALARLVATEGPDAALDALDWGHAERSDAEEAEYRLGRAAGDLSAARARREELRFRIREELLPNYEQAKRAAAIYGVHDAEAEADQILTEGI